MSYATPARFIESFGLEETVQYLSDEQRLLTAQLLLDALAGSWSGAPTVEEKAAAEAAVARITRKLETQSNLMDGYLRPAVVLPLSADDANAGTLEECCLALVRCALADDTDNATERMDDCCKTWRAWLRDISTGKAKLAGAGGQAIAPSGGARSGQTRTNYDWAAFRPSRGARS
ncbi:phage protein Gp36 family protein [Variovorax sp. E3]|uniref:phage protein Gp36 family protein n=1 Tax=Variovorax sp. E3 TaxID=1914993 RepID=UPI0018DC4158|nr:phage protein Gp36 family protein [Variovorax sp. E3]